ncbi:hypothetical protein ACQBAU_16255 [Propionibacteriaceae bacterium Y2011]
MRNLPAAVAAAVSVLALTSCLSLPPEVGATPPPGPVSTEMSEPAPSSEASKEEPAPSPTEAEFECLEVTDEFAVTILDGAPDGTAKEAGYKLIKAAAVKSPDHKEVYVVAIRFDAPGGDPVTGVWATTSLTTGPILSVDGFAKNFTQWPDGTKQSGITGVEPYVQAAKGCVA